MTLTEPPIPDPPTSIHVEFAEASGANTLPVADAVPTLAQLNALLKETLAVAPDPLELTPHVAALADDWRTEGDWLGRYGRYWACLCACCSPYDYLWGAGWRPIEYHLGLGENHAPGDALRYWVHWKYTDDPRVLELPPTYLDSRIERGLTDRKHGRREAEQLAEYDPARRHAGPGRRTACALFSNRPAVAGRAEIRFFAASSTAGDDAVCPGLFTGSRRRGFG